VRRAMTIAALTLVAVSSLACRFSFSLPTLPDISLPAPPDIDLPQVPRLEIGPLQEFDEEVPRNGAEEMQVEIVLGAGEISMSAGDPDPLFAGSFRTNVAEWAPEVTASESLLHIEQGHAEGMAEPGARNEWDLRFSPEVALDMDLEIGACQGELDLTDLALTRLSLETGASDLIIHFGAPNPARMDSLSIRAGAASLRLEGIGNASPRLMTVKGGVGNLFLDLSGSWAESARVDVEAGMGSLTILLPRDVGVRVEGEVLGSINVGSGLSRVGDAYVNDAYGETETELVVELAVGVGDVELSIAGE